MFALVIAGKIHELFAQKPVLHKDMRLIDVTAVKGVAEGWLVAADGTVTAPPPPPPPSVAQLVAYAKRKQAEMLAAGITVDVAAAGQGAVPVLADGLPSTVAHLVMLGSLGTSATWLDNQDQATLLSAAEIAKLANAVNHWVADLYAALASVIDAATAQPPTITSFAAIDSYAWPLS